MTNSNDDGAPRPQAEVDGDLDGAGTLNGVPAHRSSRSAAPTAGAARRRGRIPTSC